MFSLEIIKEKIENYIEFDSKKLFKNTDYAVIFGGSLRDSIANLPINDIDILCLSKSFITISENIQNEGYKYIPLFKKEILDLYRDIKYIFEPHTFVKGDKIIQLIKPNYTNVSSEFFTLNDKDKHIVAKKIFLRLLSNVDLSCCGMFWDGDELFESVPLSVKHSFEKKFLILEKSLMLNKQRLSDRIRKMNERGFDRIYLKDENPKQKIRIDKLTSILSDVPQIDDFIMKIGFDKELEKFENNNKKTYKKNNYEINDIDEIFKPSGDFSDDYDLPF